MGWESLFYIYFFFILLTPDLSSRTPGCTRIPGLAVFVRHKEEIYRIAFVGSHKEAVKTVGTIAPVYCGLQNMYCVAGDFLIVINRR
jgi:hypothetical protein